MQSGGKILIAYGAKREMNNLIEGKSFNFAVKIVELYRFLTGEQRETVLSKQLLRSGTSIGANVSEAERGQTKADFRSKMCIALKEANETQYWIRLLYKTNYISDEKFKELNKEVEELISILVAITKNTK